MLNYTICENYTLPSKGKVYNVLFDPTVEIRSMTTNEEMRRLNQSEKPLRTLSSIIDDCIIKKLPISSYDMCFADFLFLLHKLRIVTYGEDYTILSVCPYCGSVNKDSIKLGDMNISEFKEDILNLLHITLPKTKIEIELNILSPRILDNIAAYVKDRNKKSKNEDSSVLATLLYTIKKVDGQELDELQKEDFIRNLPMADTNKILSYINKFNEGMGIDMHLDIECNSCGLLYQNSFRETSEFFRPTVD